MLRHAARRAFYRSFYGMPAQWRRRIVRLLKPRYTVGAVTIVRAYAPDGTDRLLMVRHPGHRGWSLPAGLLDRGEKPVETAVRELREETGVALTVGEVSAADPNVIVHGAGWVDCVYLARVPLDTPLTVDGAEVRQAAFHPIDKLPAITTPTAALLSHYGLGPRAEQRDR
jgi:ADP-ribose pyrophosphatase YjhB (NUDIX family)